ncbi:MAG: hypothetical protein IKD69_15435 [Solobacterium sp.]|nr:hypothetical protein [Solobacterium sp.]
MPENEERGFGILHLILPLVLIAVFGGLFLFARSLDGRSDRETHEINEEISVIERQISNLQAEIEDIEGSFEGRGCFEYVFLDPPADFAETIKPLFDQYNIICLLAFSEDRLPGDEGAMSAETVNDLIWQGYRTALRFDGVRNLQKTLDDVRATMNERGLGLPDTICFEPGVYAERYDEVMRENNVYYAIFRGIDRDEISFADEGANPWVIGGIGYYSGGYVDKILNCYAHGGNLVLLMDSGSSGMTFTEQYFRSITESLFTRNVTITDLENGRRVTAENRQFYDAWYEGASQQMNDLYEQIKILEKQAETLRASYE